MRLLIAAPPDIRPEDDPLAAARAVVNAAILAGLVYAAVLVALCVVVWWVQR